MTQQCVSLDNIFIGIVLIKDVASIGFLNFILLLK